MYNRRYALETCRREFSRATRGQQSVSILSIDVDHFKKFNDNHGHDAGDTVLRSVADCLVDSFRDDDVASRFGGEEFVVILPNATAEQAEIRAEQVRARIEAMQVRYLENNLPRVSVSIGVAAFPLHGKDPTAVLRSADEALYGAKDGGRNCVVLQLQDRAIWQLAQVPLQNFRKRFRQNSRIVDQWLPVNSNTYRFCIQDYGLA